MKKYWFLLLAVTPLLASFPQTSGGIRYIMDYGSVGNLYKCGGCSGGCSPVVDDNTSSPIRVKLNAGTPLSYCSFNNSGSIGPFKPKMIIYASKYLENSPQMGGIILKHFSDFTTLLNGGVGNQPLIAGFGSLSLEQKDTVLRAISKYDRNSFMMALNFNSVKFWENNRTNIQKFMAELTSGIDGKDKDMYEKKWKELSTIIEAGVQLYNWSTSSSVGRLLSRDYISRSLAQQHISEDCETNHCWIRCAKKISNFSKRPVYLSFGRKKKQKVLGYIDPLANKSFRNFCISKCGFASSGGVVGRACTSHAHIFSEGRSGTDLKTATEFARAVGQCVRNLCTGGSSGLSGKIGRAKEIGAIFSAISASETDKGRRSLHPLYNNPAVKELNTFFTDIYLREIKDFAHEDFIGEMSSSTGGDFSSIVKFISNTKLTNGFSSLSKLYATGANISETPPPAKAEVNRPEIPDGRTPDPEPPESPHTGGASTGASGTGQGSSIGSSSVGGANNKPFDGSNPNSYECPQGDTLYVVAVSHIGGETKNNGLLQNAYDKKFGAGVVGTKDGLYLACGKRNGIGFNVTKKLGFLEVDVDFAEEFKKCYRLAYEGEGEGAKKGDCYPLFEKVFYPFTSMTSSSFSYAAILNFKTGVGFDWSDFAQSKAQQLFAARNLTSGNGALLRRFKTYRMKEVSYTPAKKEDESSRSVCRVEEISRDWVSYPESGAPRGYRLEFKMSPDASVCDHSIAVFSTKDGMGGAGAGLSAEELQPDPAKVTSGDGACLKTNLIREDAFIRTTGGDRSGTGRTMLFAKSGVELTPSTFTDPKKILSLLSGSLQLKYGLNPWVDVSMERPITDYGKSIAERIRNTPNHAEFYESKMLETSETFSLNRAVFMSAGTLGQSVPPQYEHHKFLSYDRGCNPGEKHTVDCKNCSSPGGGSAVYKGVTITR